MPTTYPTTVDTFVDPTPTSPMNNPSHAGEHSNANDAIAAVETFVGTSGVPNFLEVIGGTMSGAIAMGSNKITGIANGSAVTDVAALGQTLQPTATQTMSNKRWTRRVVPVTQSATPAIATDTTDVAVISGIAQAVTSMTTSLTGTPNDGDTLMVRLSDNGSAWGITWGAKFAATTVALPTTTTVGSTTNVGFQWNATAGAWECLGIA